jgi:hypothetical protein
MAPSPDAMLNRNVLEFCDGLLDCNPFEELSMMYRRDQFLITGRHIPF